MSGKQAKRLRQQQRAQGIEPRLDAKRRRGVESAALLEKQRAEAKAFRLNHPEEYAQQQQEKAEKLRHSMTRFAAILGTILG